MAELGEVVQLKNDPPLVVLGCCGSFLYLGHSLSADNRFLYVVALRAANSAFAHRCGLTLLTLNTGEAFKLSIELSCLSLHFSCVEVYHRLAATGRPETNRGGYSKNESSAPNMQEVGQASLSHEHYCLEDCRA